MNTFANFLTYFVTLNIHREALGYVIFEIHFFLLSYMYLFTLIGYYTKCSFIDNTMKYIILLFFMREFPGKTRCAAHIEDFMPICC